MNRRLLERILIAPVSDAVELQWNCVVCLSVPYHKYDRNTHTPTLTAAAVVIKTLCSLQYHVVLVTDG